MGAERRKREAEMSKAGGARIWGEEMHVDKAKGRRWESRREMGLGVMTSGESDGGVSQCAGGSANWRAWKAGRLTLDAGKG